MIAKTIVLGIIATFVTSVGVMIGGSSNASADHGDAGSTHGCFEFHGQVFFGTPPWAESVGRDIVSPITKLSPGDWSDTVNTVHEAAC